MRGAARRRYSDKIAISNTEMFFDFVAASMCNTHGSPFDPLEPVPIP